MSLKGATSPLATEPKRYANRTVPDLSKTGERVFFIASIAIFPSCLRSPKPLHYCKCKLLDIPEPLLPHFIDYFKVEFFIFMNHPVPETNHAYKPSSKVL